MKGILWGGLTIGLTGLAFWIILGPWFPDSTIAMGIVWAFFAAPSVGGLWMLYMAIRHEQRPWRIVLLAFFPYTFVWYYFDRVRQGKHITRRSTA